MTVAPRILLVGTGAAARARARAVHALAGPDALVGVVSRRPAEAAADLQIDRDLPAFDDLGAAIRALAPGAVCLAHPNALHGRDAAAALGAGAHVLVEYPLALSAAEAEVLVDAARRSGLSLHVGHIELVSPVQEALERARSGLGALRTGRVTSAVPCPEGDPSWHGDPSLAGPPPFAQVSRLTRLLRLVGPLAVRESTLTTVPGTAPGGPSYDLRAGLDDGRGGSAEVRLSRGPGIPDRAQSLDLSFVGGRVTSDGGSVQVDGRPVPLAPAKGLFQADTRVFLDSLYRLAAPLSPAPPVLQALRLADEIARTCGAASTTAAEP